MPLHNSSWFNSFHQRMTSMLRTWRANCTSQAFIWGTFLDTPLVELNRPKRWTSPDCQAYLNSERSGVHPSRYGPTEKSAWYIYSKYHYNHTTCICSYYYHYYCHYYYKLLVLSLWLWLWLLLCKYYKYVWIPWPTGRWRIFAVEFKSAWYLYGTKHWEIGVDTHHWHVFGILNPRIESIWSISVSKWTCFRLRNLFGVSQYLRFGVSQTRNLLFVCPPLKESFKRFKRFKLLEGTQIQCSHFGIPTCRILSLWVRWLSASIRQRNIKNPINFLTISDYISIVLNNIVFKRISHGISTVWGSPTVTIRMSSNSGLWLRPWVAVANRLCWVC